MSIVLEARGLKRDYTVRRGMFAPPATVHALAGVSFDLESGKTLAVVGESGSGKSTLARLLTMIETPTAGTLKINGIDLVDATKAQRKTLRSEVQIVFQNPYGSLNPRQTIGAALEEPLIINTTLSSTERAEAVASMMARVGLRPEFKDRYPHMFSGGQRQRIAIARAILRDAPILLLDEATSALDAENETLVQAALDELMQGRTTLVIAHRLATILECDRILVMEGGRIVETGTHESLVNAGGLYARLAQLQFDAGARALHQAQ